MAVVGAILMMECICFGLRARGKRYLPDNRTAQILRAGRGGPSPVVRGLGGLKIAQWTEGRRSGRVLERWLDVSIPGRVRRMFEMRAVCPVACNGRA